MPRHDGRNPDELRPITFERDYTEMAAGSVLVSFGRTRVLCTASIDEDVPRWMKNSGKGWVTAEYSMLPGSSPERVDREAAKGKQSGRTVEIQRLIGRSLRAACDMMLLGERQVVVDCDVLQADGGTRTASICGGYLALHDALTRLVQNGLISAHPLHSRCAAISVGIVGGSAVLDLPYAEDSTAEVDMNVVVLGQPGAEPKFVEVQGTAEGQAFSRSELDSLLGLATGGLAQIIDLQAVGFRLADAKTKLEAARQLTLYAARLKADGRPALEAACMAKLFASEAAEAVCTASIQTLGGYGFLADYPVERIYRDVRVCQIYEGTSDVQKLILQRML